MKNPKCKECKVRYVQECEFIHSLQDTAGETRQQLDILEVKRHAGFPFATPPQKFGKCVPIAPFGKNDPITYTLPQLKAILVLLVNLAQISNCIVTCGHTHYASTCAGVQLQEQVYAQLKKGVAMVKEEIKRRKTI